MKHKIVPTSIDRIWSVSWTQPWAGGAPEIVRHAASFGDDVDAPHVAGIRKPGERCEAAIRGVESLVVTEMPFPDHMRVMRFSQYVRDGSLGGTHSVHRSRPKVPLDARARRQSSSEQRTSARCANREPSMKVVKDYSFVAHYLHVRCLFHGGIVH